MPIDAAILTPTRTNSDIASSPLSFSGNQQAYHDRFPRDAMSLQRELNDEYNGLGFQLSTPCPCSKTGEYEKVKFLLMVHAQ
jgi:hypothetical protein